MIGLISVGPRSSASASCVADHSLQRGSSVKRSSSTFESTTVPAAGGLLVATGERHDLVGAHRDGSAAPHPACDGLSSRGLGAHQPCAAVIELEVNFGARLD